MTEDLKVFISSRESKCDECHEELSREAWITLGDGAKALEGDAVILAVTAHIRHTETPYDSLLASGWDRHEARGEVGARVREILSKWQDA